MCFLTHEDRQSILNRVYTHFVMNRQPAGRLNGASCIYHGFDENGRRVSCAIGLFDTEGRLDREPHSDMRLRDLYAHHPEALSAVFHTSDLGMDDIQFLEFVQEEHDIAVKNAACLDREFDLGFREEVAYRLARLADEQGLDTPFAMTHLS